MTLYSPLLTDQYQLVMAYSYWKLGLAEQEAVFHLSFRKLPLQSAFIVVAGLQSIIDFLTDFHFSSSDIEYLKELKINNENLFSKDFLTYLQHLRFQCDIDAATEGTLIFAKEPVLRIKGPILQCQLLETPLLNFINFASLIATKASQVYLAANGDPVIEFGLRRAQGPDGGITASRSAYIGGCSATSNVLAGKLFDIPISGTQAHSWIMAFDTELEAFKKFAQIMEDKTVLLVDTYDTLTGVRNAIEIGKFLNKTGKSLAGIRLDSGNLLELSRKARRLLNRANLHQTKIIASGDLDEHIIRNLKANDAPIDAWGVGTRLVTSYDQPALNAIYKLTAIKNSAGQWDYKMKLSDDPQKSTFPGILQIFRQFKNAIPIQDFIYDIELNHTFNSLDPNDGQKILQPIYRQGQLVYSEADIHTIRENTIQNIQIFSKEAPKPYPIIIAPNMQNNMDRLVEKIRSCDE